MINSSEITINDNRIPGIDRRKTPTPINFRYLVSGRRKSNRRSCDPRKNYYVDHYGIKLSAVLILIVILSLMDSIFTYSYVNRGGAEWNPIMREVLAMGPHVFFPYKYILTAVGIFFLCMHKNFRFVKTMLLLILTIYILLTFYHVTLLYAL